MDAARHAQPSADDALHRAAEMIDTARAARVSTSDGYVDVLPEAANAPTPTIAQHAMNNPVVAAIYENLWRPALGRIAMGVSSMSVDDERRRAVADLRLGGDMTVLDVACGPGNFTKFLSGKLGGDGIAVGFDISAPMLARAVRDNRGPRAAYVRGDARTLPYADATFDAVCCYAALYLVPEPFTVVGELVRVVKPGGRIALMTSYGGSFAPLRAAVTAGAAVSGIRMFEKTTFTDILRDAGFTDIDQDLRGVAQFVSATNS
jgi:SAM-dependent methyltransferase